MPGGEFSKELIEKGKQVTKYYEELPPNALASPPEPIFKDMLPNKDEPVNEKEEK